MDVPQDLKDDPFLDMWDMLGGMDDGKFDFKSKSGIPNRGWGDELNKKRSTIFIGFEKGTFGSIKPIWTDPYIGTTGSQSKEAKLMSIGRCGVYNVNSDEAKELEKGKQAVCVNVVEDSYSMFDDRLNAAYIFPSEKMQNFVVSVGDWGIYKYGVSEYFGKMIEMIDKGDGELEDVKKYLNAVKFEIENIKETYYYYNDDNYASKLLYYQREGAGKLFFRDAPTVPLFNSKLLEMGKNMTKPSLFLFTFKYKESKAGKPINASDRVSIQSIKDVQYFLGGKLMIQNSAPGRMLGVDLQDITGLKTQTEFDILKAKCNVHHKYVLEFKRILNDLFEASMEIAVDAKKIKNFSTAFSLADVKHAHTKSYKAKEGLILEQSYNVKYKGKGGKKKGAGGMKGVKKTRYISSTPLLFQKIQHVSVVVEDPYEVEGLKICFIFKKEICYNAKQSDRFLLVHKRVMCKTPLTQDQKNRIYGLNCTELTVSVRKDYESGQTFDDIELKIDADKKYTIESFTSKRTAVQFDRAHSKIQFINEPLQVVVDTTPKNSVFVNGTFSQIVLEAVPLPNWHRVREKTEFEKVTPHWWQFWKKREEIDRGDMNSTLFEDVYVQISKSVAGERGASNDVTYLCFGIEEESNCKLSTMWLQFTYIPKEARGKNAFGKIESFDFTEEGGGGSELLASLSRTEKGEIKWEVYDRFREELASGQFPSSTYLRVLHWAFRRFQDGHTVPTMDPAKLRTIIHHLLDYLELYPEDKKDVIAPFQKELRTLLDKSNAKGMELPCLLSENIELQFKKVRNFLDRHSMGEFLCELGILDKYREIKPLVFRYLTGWFTRKTKCKPLVLPISVEIVIQELRTFAKNEEMKLAILTAWYFYTLQMSQFQNVENESSLIRECEKNYDQFASQLQISITLKYETEKEVEKMKARYRVLRENPMKSPIVPFQAIALLREACGV